jgi:hypothetical protein
VLKNACNFEHVAISEIQVKEKIQNIFGILFLKNT